MDRATIRDLAKKELFRNGHTKFRDDVMNAWADESMDWLQSIRPDYWFWRTIANQTIAELDSEFVCPADLGVLISVWNETHQRELTRIERDDLNSIFQSTSTTGKPEYFFEKGSRIIVDDDFRVFGIWRAASEDTDIELTYYRRPRHMTADTGAGSQPDLPEQFHWFVKNFMVNRGAIFLEDDALMSSTWALVNNIRERIDKNHERSIKRRNWRAVRRSERVIRTLRRRQGLFESRYP